MTRTHLDRRVVDVELDKRRDWNSHPTCCAVCGSDSELHKPFGRGDLATVQTDINVVCGRREHDLIVVGSHIELLSQRCA